jgi:hypothetical protein
VSFVRIAAQSASVSASASHTSALASCVDMGDPDDPATARVNYRLTRRLLADSRTWWALEQTLGVQERPRASTDTPNPDPASG